MGFARPFALLCLALGLLTFPVFDRPVVDASAMELLVNGGFEDGTNGWQTRGANASALCRPYSDNNALAVEPDGEAVQVLPQPPGQGSYTLTFHAKAGFDTASVTAELVWFRDGSLLAPSTQSFALVSEYRTLTLQAAAPSIATGLHVRFSTEADSQGICLDSVSLEGPPPAPPAQPTSPAGQPQPPPPPSSDTMPSAPQPSQPPPSVSQPSAPAANAPQPPAQPLSFQNGDLEQGLSGWEKVGGELRSVSSPVNSGAAAGALLSNTDSTKWAYQDVAVRPAQWYEFSGYVATDAGVARAYLRISWYSSADASGSQLSTSDSAQFLSGSTSFTLVSTGSVQAPSTAQSARLRVVMTPASAAPATMYFDDLWFGPAAPGAPATEAGPAGRSVSSGSAATPSRASDREPGAGSATEAPSARGAAFNAAEPDSMPAQKAAKEDEMPMLWLAAVALLVFGLAGSYWRTRAAGHDQPDHDQPE